ncbi:MAG: GNAT family N-acetyltransferase [Bacteroidota bacterium]
MDPFETDRLLVRQFTPEDADDFYLFNSSEPVMRYIRPTKNRVESDAFLEENFNLYLDGFPYGRMFVADKTTGKFVGTFSILYLDGEADYHIGYAFMQEYWGKGYASELVKMGTQKHFERTNHSHLFAITQPLNIASERVLLKNGFILKGDFILNNESKNLFVIARDGFQSNQTFMDKQF